LLAVFIYRLQPAGNVAVIYFFATVYLLAVSGLGLIISNHSGTILQAMLVMFFFLLTSILLSGMFTPVSSMPGWARAITAVNPLRYFMEVMRAVYLKGSGISDLLPQLFILSGFAVFLGSWAVMSCRKN
jgi:ABC-2 type transport system permease protein